MSQTYLLPSENSLFVAGVRRLREQMEQLQPHSSDNEERIAILEQLLAISGEMVRCKEANS